MKKSSCILSLALLLLVGISACQPSAKQSASSSKQGDTLQLAYAENLLIIRYDDYTTVSLRNPWKQGKTLHTYVLTDRRKPQPESLPQGTRVQIPLSRSLVYSGVHCGIIEEMGAVDAIQGVCDLPYIYLPSLIEKHKQGKLTDAGNSQNPSIEKIIDLNPDAILLSPYEGNHGYGKLEKLQIPIIECADYMETSPLGRAEWIRFFGLLYGKSQEADSIFAQVEQAYRHTQALAQSVVQRPSVFSELKTGNIWYTPGGKSTTGILFADAGAKYIFGDTPQTSSLAMSFESVFDKGGNADFWFIKYNQQQEKTYSELQQEYAPYAHFKAFKEKRIYGCNTRYVRYYEESPFHPERILNDLVKIFHPELLPEYSLKYFTPLAP